MKRPFSFGGKPLPLFQNENTNRLVTFINSDPYELAKIGPDYFLVQKSPYDNVVKAYQVNIDTGEVLPYQRYIEQQFLRQPNIALESVELSKSSLKFILIPVNTHIQHFYVGSDGKQLLSAIDWKDSGFWFDTLVPIDFKNKMWLKWDVKNNIITASFKWHDALKQNRKSYHSWKLRLSERGELKPGLDNLYTSAYYVFDPPKYLFYDDEPPETFELDYLWVNFKFSSLEKYADKCTTLKEFIERNRPAPPVKKRGRVTRKYIRPVPELEDLL